MGAQRHAVEPVRGGGEALVAQPAHGLAMLQHEGHVAGAHLQHGAAPLPAGRVVAEAGIEEAGVVDAEFADLGIVGDHLGGMVGRHHDRLPGRQDVEIGRIEDQAAAGAQRDGIPEIQGVVAVPRVHIHQLAMLLGLPADEAPLAPAGEIEGHGDALAADDRILVVHQAILLLKAPEICPAAARAAAPETDLGEARPLAHDDAEGARDDLGVELALIARGHLVEGAAAVGDEAREDVEPAGGALGIGGGSDPGGEPEPLQQRHDIDAVPLQHRALGQVDLMQRELLDLVGDRRILARQEARPDPVGDGAQTQVEARRLHLSRQHVDLGPDLIVADQGADLLIGQQAGAGQAWLGCLAARLVEEFVRFRHGSDQIRAPVVLRAKSAVVGRPWLSFRSGPMKSPHGRPVHIV